MWTIDSTMPAPRAGRKTRKGPLAVALALGLSLVGCTADYATNSESPIILIITGVNSGSVLDSDVAISNGGVCPDTIEVRVENKPINPNVSAVDWRGDIVIERYEVQYYRSDGRSTPGVDVPFSISGNLAFEVIFNEDTNVPIEVVRRQAKIEPPLLGLMDNGKVVTMFAKIILHAKTNAGKASTASGQMQIDFANFADSLTSCESGGGGGGGGTPT